MKQLLSIFGLAILGTTFGSCRSAVPAPATPAAQASANPAARAAAPVKTARNTAYQTPPVSGPVPRNPDMSFTSNFGSGTGLSFSRVPVQGKYIAITFDDGPSSANTPRLLDMLRARNIKATFYVVGSNVDLYPQIVRRCVAEGHEIGNHSQTHRLLSKMSDSAVIADLTRCRDAVGRATGIQPRTLRPPYGGLLQRQREMVMKEFGYPTILWDVDPLDWKRPGSAAVCSRILKHTTPGSIILAHDIHSQTVDAMPATLDGLLQRGFKFVTVSQLLAMKAASSPAPVPADVTDGTPPTAAAAPAPVTYPATAAAPAP